MSLNVQAGAGKGPVKHTVPGKNKATYDKVPAGANVWDLALERAKQIYELHDHVAVAFSGGKDSTATLHVMLEAAHRWLPERLPLRVIFMDEEAIPMQTEQYVRRVSQRDDVTLEWYCLPITSTNACSRSEPHWWPWDPDCPEKWCRPAPPEGIFELDGFPLQPREARLPHYATNGLFFKPSVHGTSAFCMGIRAQESITRLRAVTRQLEENYLVPYTGSEADDGAKRGTILNPGNITKAYPIYDWTTEDVWTAPKIMGWDYNEAYDVMEMAGVNRSMQRCSPAFGNEPLQKLHTYQSCFPEVWDKMTTRVPGAATAARYALTELYAYRGVPPKPADKTWGQWLLHHLSKHTPEVRKKTAIQVRDWIRRHFELTTEPIVPNAPHPDSGVSWNWLVMICMRGDPKDRKQAGNRVGTNRDRERDRYLKELETYRSEGRVGELAPDGA